jgi:hypothetical protein
MEFRLSGYLRVPIGPLLALERKAAFAFEWGSLFVFQDDGEYSRPHDSLRFESLATQVGETLPGKTKRPSSVDEG